MIFRILVSIVLVYILPVLLMLGLSREQQQSKLPQTEPDSAQIMELPDDEKPQTSQSVQRTVSLLTEKGTVLLPLEDYISGVVLAEMPADFHSEALKAQAVVARTYTCRLGNYPKHTDAEICADSQCCQAYISEGDYLANGGTQEQIQKVKSSVYETAGQVLYYNGKLIEATYFSCSGGKTEDAVAVWGTDVPYLQSVVSPGEEKAAHYTDTVIMSGSEFCKKMGLQLTGEPATWFGTITYTEGGGVNTIMVGSQEYTGTYLRKMLNLRSTAFVLTAAGNSITITTKGFGHRVGMSQYGAEAMAMDGASYQEILCYYYQGVELSKLLVDKNL